MAKNIAIIIGISEYVNAKTLKGCKVDADSIRTLLDATGKYDDVLQLDGKVDAKEINQQLPLFIKKYKAEIIDEVFFYYSGHGCVFNEEFAYVASDYRNDKLNTTTLKNEVVDTLLKSLNANLVVKIIDACNSGTQYLKEVDQIPKYINRHKDEFTNCYFMFSSRNDQSSKATDSLSVFTRSFIQAVKSCSSGEIKYLSIANCIADDFMTNTDQKPQFVQQADLTEVFCFKDAKLDGILDTLLIAKPPIPTPNTKPVDTDTPLVRAVKLDSLSYRSEAQIFEILENAKESLSEIKHSEELSELFDISISYTKDLYGFTKKNEIGEWLSKRKHNYFANTERSSYDLSNWILAANSVGKKEQKEPQDDGLLNSFLKMDNTYVSGFSNLINYPFELVTCLFLPKHVNLHAFKVQMTFVCSNTELVLFSYTTEIKNVKEMKDFSYVNPLAANTIKFADGDICDVFKEQIIKGEEAILTRLKNQFFNAPDSSIG